MPKKVSELTKELDISFQELKGYADKMGIAVSSARSSVEDQDAERLIRSINMMRGTSSGAQAGAGKPKIKAVPVVPKDGARPKPPMGKPVIPAVQKCVKSYCYHTRDSENLQYHSM